MFLKAENFLKFSFRSQLVAKTFSDNLENFVKDLLD